MKKILPVVFILISHASVLAQLYFAPRVNYTLPVSSTFVNITNGDFNKDGIQDLVVANFSGASVSVFLGLGPGTFGSPQNYTTGSGTGGISVFDANVDGNPDIAVTNFSSNSISVLLGNGTGSFSPHQTYGTGSGPQSPILGDYNEDGKIDIAVANYTGNTVSILIGDGAGAFTPTTSIPTGTNPQVITADFNDIRTTLQALYAIYDNCNSLHTNAYDEAITTPTEESVRRAMAIQLIINKELGLAKNENPLQGSFIIEELTDLVEEAVLTEFDRITERGGVLGAMETMYQRGKIQEESLYYETLKHTGEFPIIGVNTFLSSKGSPTIIPQEVIRATTEEKEYQIKMLRNLHEFQGNRSAEKIDRVQQAAVQNQNIFAELMEVCKTCSLGQITKALFEVGGQYRRNM